MFARRWVLRLYFLKQKPIFYQINQYVTSTPVEMVQTKAKSNTEDMLQKKIEKFTDKILYNTLIHGTNYSYPNERLSRIKEIKRWQAECTKQQSEEAFPLSLTCLPGFKEVKTENELCEDEYEMEEKQPYHLPFKSQKMHCDNSQKEKPADDLKPDIKKKHWMTDYDCFDDGQLSSPGKIRHGNTDPAEELEEEFAPWKLDYGTADPSVPPSRIPCTGCGSILHCIDTTIPGYLPSELFMGVSREQLKAMTCQRCHFLKEYNIALNLSVDPDEYPQIISKLKSERAFVVLIVDILDFPNSIWPGIMDIIGHKRPIIIVGNKVDLLPPDQPGYLDHMKDCLCRVVADTNVNEANIKDVILISAKTGFGVERLITQLQMIWRNKGDVYIVGCTNVGKSTLFNAFLQSDLCKVSACDLLQRATVSLWPGTTLNLLNFPMLRLTDWRMKKRAQRLNQELKNLHAERKLRVMRSGNPNLSLMGYIGKTFANIDNAREIVGDPFSYRMNTGFKQSSPVTGIDEFSDEYCESKWCYDTPGVVHPEQILSILTLDELAVTLPKSIIKPRTFYMYPKTTVLLAGLGRLDLLENDKAVRFTVFAAEQLPITVCKTEDVDAIYEEFLGTEVLGVPMGDSDRLKNWPKLQKGNEISVVGEGEKVCFADITLSSAGWISMSGYKDSPFKVLPWTPEGKGIYCRTPALLPNAVYLKGKRMKGSPAYNVLQKVE